MSAYGDLEALLGGTPLARRAIDAALAEHAHELAEKQREKRKDWEVRAFNGGYAALNAVDDLIDLIDPEKPDA